jgi:hypothetical protein
MQNVRDAEGLPAAVTDAVMKLGALRGAVPFLRGITTTGDKQKFEIGFLTIAAACRHAVNSPTRRRPSLP